MLAVACRHDPSIFPAGLRISLNDKKIFDVVRTLQEVSFVRTDVDSIGIAFENFFGSVFRGELGQYFTMRQLARFAVAMLAARKKMGEASNSLHSAFFELNNIIDGRGEEELPQVDDQIAEEDEAA